MPYTDYGPRPEAPQPYETAAERTRRMNRMKRSRWTTRPHCDMCGPFRGRYLRYMPSLDEYRCKGCDEE